jgi:hypothetical protein
MIVSNIMAGVWGFGGLFATLGAVDAQTSGVADWTVIIVIWAIDLLLALPAIKIWRRARR